jgi:hypothetical protein
MLHLVWVVTLLAIAATILAAIARWVRPNQAMRVFVGSDPLKRQEGLGRQLDLDLVARFHSATRSYNGHDPGLSDQCAVAALHQDRIEQTRHEILNLGTGIAQPRHFQANVDTNAQDRMSRKRKQVNPACGNVFTQIRCMHRETAFFYFLKQLLMNEVHLPKVGLIRVRAHARAMHLDAKMRVTLNPMILDDTDFWNRRFRETVSIVMGYANYVHRILMHCGQSGLVKFPIRNEAHSFDPQGRGPNFRKSVANDDLSP